MTNEEIVTMIQSGMNRKEGIEQLYLQNKGLIYRLSKPFFQLCDNTVAIDVDDILQEAFIGLVEAVDRWDSSKGVAFMSYAGFYIQKQIRLSYNNKSKSIRYPIYLQERLNHYNAFLSQYRSDHLGMDPSDAEIEKELELSGVQVKELKRALFLSTVVSLDKIVMADDEEGSTESELFQDSFDLEESTVDRIYNDERTNIVWECVESLPDAMQSTIHARYEESKSLREVGEELGCSRQSISNREKEALKRLREDARIQMLAETEGFLDTSKIYKDGLQRFQNTGSSVVEELALKGAMQSKRYEEDRSRLDKFIKAI